MGGTKYRGELAQSQTASSNNDSRPGLPLSFSSWA